MRGLKVVGLAVLAEVLLIAAAVIVMLVYSTVVHPDERPGFYEVQARVIVPWVALGVSFPLFYWLSRWSGPWPLALGLWMIHVLMDAAISLSTDGVKGLAAIALFWLSSQALKLAGCWLGGRHLKY